MTRSRKRTWCRAVAATAFVLCFGGRAAAATYTWNVGGGPWHDPASWSPNGVPSTDDVAILHDGLVEMDADADVGTVQMLSGILYGAGTLTTSTLVWSGGTMQDLGLTAVTTSATISGNVVLGQRTLRLDGTSTLTGNAFIDVEADARIDNYGTFTFANDGGGNQGLLGGYGLFTTHGILRKAAGNTGTTLFNVGLASGPTGTIEVLSGTVRVNQGVSFEGTMVITAPGRVDVRSHTLFGATSSISGTGIMRFSDWHSQVYGTYDMAHTEVDHGRVTFGAPITNVGTLTVTSGTAEFAAWTEVPVASLTLGGGGPRIAEVTGIANVTVSGPSTWLSGRIGSSSQSFPTYSFEGGLTISTSGAKELVDSRLSCVSGTCAITGADTVVSVLGETSLIANYATFELAGDASTQGVTGDGEFNNTAVGTLRRPAGSSGTSTIGMYFTNQGTVETVAGTLAFPVYYSQGAGTTRLAGGSLTAPTMFLLGGRLVGEGTVTGDVLSTGGTVAPGASPGTITVDGLFDQFNGGRYEVELGGTQPGAFDRMAIGGSFLSGTLAVSLTNGYVPQPGDTFEILSSTGLISGDFAAMTGPTLGAGLALQKIVNQNSVVLKVVSLATPTPTVTATATLTTTVTATPTATATATPTPSATVTRTLTPTTTGTPTPTATATPTATPTQSPTATESPTATATATTTATPTTTVTATPSTTATVSPTPTDSPTPTPSPSVTPSATPTAEPTATASIPSCSAGPVAGCRTPTVPAKAMLTLRAGTTPRSNQLVWKWLQGAPTLLADFGDPPAGDDLALCVYEANGLVTDAIAPGGGMCGPQPCWRVSASSLKYKRRDGAPDGINGLQLKEGLVVGKSRILLKAKGVNLVVPPLADVTGPLTVQLVSTTGACWEAVYSEPFRKHDARTLQDRAD